MFEDSVSPPSIWASVNSWFTPTVLFVLLNVMIGTIAITSSLANNQKQPPRQNHQAQGDGDEDGSPQQPKLGRSTSFLQRLRSINLYSYRTQEPIPAAATHFESIPDSNSETTNYPSELANSNHASEPPRSISPFDFGETQYLFQHNQHQNALQSETQYDFHPTGQPNGLETGIRYGLDEKDKEEEEEENGEVEEPQSLDEIYNQLQTDRLVNRTKSDTKPASGEAPARLPTKMMKSASMKSPFAHFEEKDIVEARPLATMRERSAKPTEADEEVDARADDFINRFKHELKLQKLDSIIRYKEMINRGSEK